MKWGIYLLIGLLLISVVNAINFSDGEVFGEYDGPMFMELDNGTVIELHCVDIKQLFLEETGWDQIYCRDNETYDVGYIQGDFKYGRHPNNNDVEEVPEFGVIAGMIGLIGAGLIYTSRREND